MTIVQTNPIIVRFYNNKMSVSQMFPDSWRMSGFEAETLFYVAFIPQRKIGVR